MYIDDQTRTLASGKISRRILLRNSYRVNGKVCHDTIANLTVLSNEEIAALKLALKHKGDLSKLKNIKHEISVKQGYSVGSVWMLQQAAKRLGIKKTLGNSKDAKLALWLIMATLIEQGSRLSATRLAKRHAVCDILGIEDGFNEDDLYAAMDWLEENQPNIEDKLFKFRYKNETPNFYLYDVTSSYFEGEQNELANYGYNRDKKQGKMQIVIGLMTDDDGHPITVEVFKGNTQDPKTVSSQIKKMANRFKVEKVTLVGDRGMIKSMQIKELNDDHQFNYITAITKVQIKKLINSGVIQPELFDNDVAEVGYEGIRYVIRRNPTRAEEIENVRQSKLSKVEKLVEEKNKYLAEHSRAKVQTAKEKIQKKINRLNLEKWLEIKTEERLISLEIDKKSKEEESRFDGCYAIKTNLPKKSFETKQVHDSYKGLSVVENAFRTMKTGFLEMRPIFVRKSERTRAHVFIIMLAYMIEHYLREQWREIDVTVEEGIAELSSLNSLTIKTTNNVSYQTIPKPRKLGKELLDALRIALPSAITATGAIVHTRKKLTSER